MALTSAEGRRFNPLSLDAVNLLLADVRGALGPYLNVFLVSQQHWSLSEVGLVTRIGGLLGLSAQTPIGAVIDETRAKCGAIVLALAVLAIGASVIFALPSFWPVLIANSLVAIVGDIFGPAVAAVTLGLYARKQLARRMGRNSAFDHAGNVAIAVVVGAVGYAFSQRAVFLLVPVFAVLTGIAVLSIPYKAIDFERARDLDQDDGPGAGIRIDWCFTRRRPRFLIAIDDESEGPVFIASNQTVTEAQLRDKLQSQGWEHIQVTQQGLYFEATGSKDGRLKKVMINLTSGRLVAADSDDD